MMRLKDKTKIETDEPLPRIKLDCRAHLLIFCTHVSVETHDYLTTIKLLHHEVTGSSPRNNLL
jgi:hypothetical protein